MVRITKRPGCTGRALMAIACLLSISSVQALQCPRDNVFYVRRCPPTTPSQCNDANDGKTPHTAWATLQRAANNFNRVGATSGEVTIVGPGVYREGDIDLRASGQLQLPRKFLADPNGDCTGDPPGPVLLNGEQHVGAGFLILGSRYVIVSGFQITGGRDAGIQVRRGLSGERSVGVVVANNVIFGNGSAGLPSRAIDVTDAEATTVFNNLIYDNAGNGIGILSAPDSRVINNTVYGHPRFGVVIAQQPAPPPPPLPSPTPGPSTGSWLLNNIIANNATSSEPAFSVDVDLESGCDYIGAFNLISAPPEKAYSTESPRDASDILTDPRFVAPASSDFHLRPDSPGIDAGSDAATRLKLSAASVRSDGGRDSGPVDLGFHFGSEATPMFDAVPATTQTLFVREQGDDANDGSSPDNALRSIGRAIDRARAVSRVVVGPGTYREGVMLPASHPAGPIEFYADAEGRLTQEAPGRVVVDPNGASAGINIIGHCSTVVDGFVVTDGGDDGIRLKSAHGSIVRKNTAVSNAARGINVVDTDDAQIINNLTYANVGGIQVGGTSVGSQNAVIQNNTVYHNSADGILIGTGPAGSFGARVQYNIIADNGQIGVQLDDNLRGGRSAVGFCAEYNVVFHADPAKRYGPILSQNCDVCRQVFAPCVSPMCEPPTGQCALAPRDDLIADPQFVRPVAGRDGCLGGRRFWDDQFFLDLGPNDNHAINLAPITARSVGLSERNTESCSMSDHGNLDAGFHALDECFTDIPPMTGDCNGDRCVTIDETVTGVNIVLERRPLSACPAFDGNGNGRVTVDEVVSAVNDSLCCSATQ